MYSLYEELLSEKHIDEEVERLYKAYLDARLVEIRRRADHDQSAVFRKTVRKFRHDNLDPFAFEDPNEQQKGFTEHQNTARDRFERDKECYAYKRQLLYWFEVRATYWFEQYDKKLAALLEPRHVFKDIHALAMALQTRIDSVKRVAAEQKKVYAGAPPTGNDDIDYIVRHRSPSIAPAAHEQEEDAKKKHACRTALVAEIVEVSAKLAEAKVT